MKPIYVLIMENGEAYDDYSEEVAGVFASLVSVKNALKKGIRSPSGYTVFRSVEKWVGTKPKAFYAEDLKECTKYEEA